MQFLNMTLIFSNIVALVLVLFSENLNMTIKIACHEQENQEQSPNPGEDKRRK